jgi:Bacterial antitoxin of type II TA system, VapB
MAGKSKVKTTLDIPDPLLREARKIALREHTTLRALVEQGLRKIIAERKATRPFRLRRVTFKGQGLVPELDWNDWDKIRDLAYEGRGG